MNGIWIWILITLSALVVGAGIGYILKQSLVERERERDKTKTDDLLEAAQKRASDLELRAKNQALEIRQAAEAEVVRRRNEVNREEDRLQKRREELDMRTDQVEKRDQMLSKRQSALDRRTNEIERMHAEHMEELQRISQMSLEEARSVLLAEVEKDARNDMARIIRQVEAEAREEGDRRAREIITAAIQRVASEHVSEITTSVVPLPADEMKGRIIGRNGRNIHAFEQVAGVDVIVDDTPEAVTISCFDPVRREIARRALAKLVIDGRIHPAHIEKVLKNEQKEVERDIVEAGEQAAYDAGWLACTRRFKNPGAAKIPHVLRAEPVSPRRETAHVAPCWLPVVADVEVAKLGAAPRSGQSHRP
jgi:ribonuclease Y